MSDIYSPLTRPALETLFANARLTNRALVIVEGIDDIQFYSRVAKTINKEFIIKAIENIAGYTEGCSQVIKATEDIQAIYSEQEINKNYYLAIVDNDSRRFRQEEIILPGLFRLKYYSHESHLFTNNNFKTLLMDLTSVSHSLVDDAAIEEVRGKIEEEIVSKLYFPALEALKNAIEEGYNSLVGYSTPSGKIFNDDVMIAKLEEKVETLNAIATQLGLTKNYETIRYIAKGKWILRAYSRIAKSEIIKLNEKCRNDEIKKCQYCEKGSYDKCLYKMQLNPQEGQLIEIIKNILDMSEIQYITDRLVVLN